MLPASIIIVLYNGIKYLPASLESVQAQVGSPAEIIVIDNASSDGGAAWIAEHYPGVQLVRNEKNTGFAAACNQGAALAKGDTFIFLNQDTRVCPGWLDGLVRPLDADPTIGVVTSKLLLMMAPDKIDMCGQNIHYSGLAFGRGSLAQADQYHEPALVSAVSGASFSIRRDLWEKLGGFDPQNFMYYEDTDLCLRSWLAGYSSYYSPDSVAYHDDRLMPSTNAIYYSARNRWALLLKIWKKRTLLLLGPGLLISEFIDWGITAMYGRNAILAKLRACSWMLTNIPDILRRRAHAQKPRVKPDWYILDQCSPVLAPTVKYGGGIGKQFIAAVNVLLRWNYQAALRIEKGLNW